MTDIRDESTNQAIGCGLKTKIRYIVQELITLSRYMMALVARIDRHVPVTVFSFSAFRGPVTSAEDKVDCHLSWSVKSEPQKRKETRSQNQRWSGLQAPARQMQPHDQVLTAQP